MASAAAQAEYLADALDFAAEMKENGQEASFGNLAAGARRIDPPGDYVETGKAFIFPLDWTADFSDDVRSDDLMFFASNETDLEACKKMQVGGLERTLQKVKPFKPDGVTVIFYEIQVRGGKTIAVDTADVIGWDANDAIGWDNADSIGWAA